MAISQMMQHYLDMKEKYKDCVLFYRLGDFYEMFFDDALTASKELDRKTCGNGREGCDLRTAIRSQGG